MNRVWKSMAIGLSLIAGSQAMDAPVNDCSYKRITTHANLVPSERSQKHPCVRTVLEPNLLKNCPTTIQGLLWEKTAVNYFSEMSYSNSLKRLRFIRWIFGGNKNEKNPINGNWFKNAILSGYSLEEADYENCLLFLDGKLKYTPNVGKPIVLPIANLKNPFDSEFNLSSCGDAGTYLSINTGFRKEQRAENLNKLEIWFTPWFVARKNVNSTATHLERIITKWDGKAAPVGIFWDKGKFARIDWYDFLITENPESISNKNLRYLWNIASACHAKQGGRPGTVSSNFYISFEHEGAKGVARRDL